MAGRPGARFSRAALTLAVLAALATGAVAQRFVLVSGSRDWLNYRHASNAASLYSAIIRRGVPERDVTLLLADDPSSNERNAAFGEQRWGDRGAVGWRDAPRVALRGEDVDVDAVRAAVAGTAPRAGAAGRPLVVLLTGHGGDDFLKVQEDEDLTGGDLAAALDAAAAHASQVLVFVDTCQASTLCAAVTAPRTLCVSSSAVGESSRALHADASLGVHVVDEFSAALAGRISAERRGDTLADLVAHLAKQTRSSTVQVHNREAFGRNLATVPLAEFFGPVGRTPRKAKPPLDGA